MTPDAQLARTFARFSTPDNSQFFDALCRHLAPLVDHPCVAMYFEFAITTNARGRAVASLLGRHKSLQGATYLDIGCAYGGFLVAFAERGARVTGIDIDPQLLGLARHNLADHRVTAPLLEGDATDLATLAEFQSAIDVATCNDVIEHVADPPALVRAISTVLAPGGLCYLEIPNACFPGFVLSDGHFQLFGITLLDVRDAEAYWDARYPGQPYQKVHYFPLEGYERMCRDAGLTMQVLPETFTGITVELTNHFIAALEAAAANGLESLPDANRPTVADALEQYLAEVKAFPRDDANAFLVRYGASFWKVLVSKAAV